MNGRLQPVFQIVQHHGRIVDALAERFEIVLSLAVLGVLRIDLFRFHTVDFKHIRRAILLQESKRKAADALHNDVCVIAEQLRRSVIDHVLKFVFKIVGALRQRIKEPCQGFAGLLSRHDKVKQVPVGLPRHRVLFSEIVL